MVFQSHVGRTAYVRYWHKADMTLSALHMSAFGGKADMAFCTANVRFMTQSGHGYRPSIAILPT